MRREGILNLFGIDVVDQRINFILRQALAKRGHNRPAKLDPYFHILPARLTMTHRQSLVLEKMIQARAEFVRMRFVLLNVMTDGAVLAIKITPYGQVRR